MKSLFGLSVFAFFALFLSGCESYTTPASSIGHLTPVPGAVPSPTEDIPALRGRYVYDIVNPLDLLGDGIAYYAAKPFGVMQDAYAVVGDQIIFRGTECDHAVGTYRWALEQGLLVLSPLSDPCQSRAGMLSNLLTRLPQQFPFATMQWERPLGLAAWNQAAMDMRGSFYVTDGSSGFYKLNPDGSGAAGWPNALTHTTGIAVDEQGDIYVANFDDATIHEFGADGQPVRSWSVGGGTDGPSALAIDAQGNLYVALRRVHDHYIEKYAPDGRLLASWAGTGNGDGQAGAGFKTGPEGITVDAGGNVYLADTVNSRIIKFDPNGVFLFNIPGDGDRMLFEPTTVAVDSKGNVYTVSNQAIWRFDNAGRFTGEWFIPYVGNLVVDAKDNLFLIGQSIVKIGLTASAP